MSQKNTRISEVVKANEGRGLDPHYLGFFDCFNRQEFFEAHEVLEALWLRQRGLPNALFYKGLIQLAGAFVHVQKQRRGPAAALFHLAQANLKPYGPAHEGLALESVLAIIEEWLEKVQNPALNIELKPGLRPALLLVSGSVSKPG